MISTGNHFNGIDYLCRFVQIPSSMKKICFYTIIITLFFGCDSSTKKTKIIDYLNDEASAIIKIKNVGSLNGNINNNPFLQQLETSNSYQKLSQKLEPTSYPTWTGILELPANKNLEWKCVKAVENSLEIIQWQPDSNTLSGNNEVSVRSSEISITGGF